MGTMTTVNSLTLANDTLVSSHKIETTTETGNNTASRKSATLTDTITLSAEATAALANTSSVSKADPQVSYYAQFFPTRDGGGTVFAENVINPAATTISTSLNATQIAHAARASMDAEYSTMAASGKPYDYSSKDGIDDYTLMSGLDRTALAAVASNQDGLFTKNEQNSAQAIMLQQEHLAIGNYAGPTDLESKFVTKPVSGQGYADDFSQTTVSHLSNITNEAVSWEKNLSLYLDKSSTYEKSTVEWAFDRASVQTAYETAMNASNQPDDPKYISNLSIVGMLSELMKNGQKHHLVNHPSVRSLSDLLSEEWAKDHETEIKNALMKTREELGYTQG